MGQEKELRKHENLSGTKVRLGDGDEWVIPAMPLGRKRLKLLEIFKKICALQEGAGQDFEAIEQGMALTAELALEMLRINYPCLTQEYFDDADLVTVLHGKRFMAILQGLDSFADLIDTKKKVETATSQK